MSQPDNTRFGEQIDIQPVLGTHDKYITIEKGGIPFLALTPDEAFQFAIDLMRVARLKEKKNESGSR